MVRKRSGRSEISCTEYSSPILMMRLFDYWPTTSGQTAEGLIARTSRADSTVTEAAADFVMVQLQDFEGLGRCKLGNFKSPNCPGAFVSVLSWASHRREFCRLSSNSDNADSFAPVRVFSRPIAFRLAASWVWWSRWAATAARR